MMLCGRCVREGAGSEEVCAQIKHINLHIPFWIEIMFFQTNQLLAPNSLKRHSAAVGNAGNTGCDSYIPELDQSTITLYTVWDWLW